MSIIKDNNIFIKVEKNKETTKSCLMSDLNKKSLLLIKIQVYRRTN